MSSSKIEFSHAMTAAEIYQRVSYHFSRAYLAFPISSQLVMQDRRAASSGHSRNRCIHTYIQIEVSAPADVSFPPVSLRERPIKPAIHGQIQGLTR